MQKEIIRFRFNGKEFEEKTIQALDLAPSLLALGELIKDANYYFNGSKTKANVLVKANIDQNCFELELGITITDIIDQVRIFLGNENIKTAKEVLEWVGLLSVPGGALGLIQLIKAIGNKSISKSTPSIDKKGIVRLEINGDNNQITIIDNVSTGAFNLYKDTQCSTYVQKLVEPINKENIENIQFESKTHNTSQFITKEDARNILTHKIEDKVVEDMEPQVVTALIKVYSPVYDLSAPKWRFYYNNKVEFFDISETNLSEMVFEYGGVNINDCFKVKLEMKQRLTMSGNITFSYKILEILEYKPNKRTQQGSLLDLLKTID